MATQRRSATHVKGAGARKKAGGARPARPAHAAARPAGVVKGKPRPAVAVKPKVAAKGGAKPAVAGKARPAVAEKMRPAVAKRVPDPAVRPLGVLPPEARARGTERAPLATPRPLPAARGANAVARPPGAQRVTEKDYKEFEERLLVERQKIMKEMGHLETTVLKVNQRDSAGDLSGYSFHMADAGTDAMEREKAFLLASAEGRILMEINEALRRLYRGEFGLCEICGEPIGRARLEAMPYTRLCLACKEKEERASRGAQ
ncbi:MAG TPA: TraR/DksA C4-type zinc finger protein [Candidatus Eisenbacteria bacterium]